VHFREREANFSIEGISCKLSLCSVAAPGLHGHKLEKMGWRVTFAQAFTRARGRNRRAPGGFLESLHAHEVARGFWLIGAKAERLLKKRILSRAPPDSEGTHPRQIVTQRRRRRALALFWPFGYFRNGLREGFSPP
jgi:hypothetical protein